MFCFATSLDSPKLTREHLLSRPVANAFGINRGDPFVRTDLEFEHLRWGTINGLGHKVVCAPCNNGWMNQLEHDVAEIPAWFDSGFLGDVREYALRSWALKTHLLLCFIEGRAGHFAEEGVDDAFVPPLTLARQVYEGDRQSIRSVAMGIARTTGDPTFAYLFGPPTMVRGKGQLTAPTSILTLGQLQIWTVTPVIDARVSLPWTVRPLAAPRTWRRLPAYACHGNLTDVLVDYDPPTLASRLAHRARRLHGAVRTRSARST